MSPLCSRCNQPGTTTNQLLIMTDTYALMKDGTLEPWPVLVHRSCLDQAIALTTSDGVDYPTDTTAEGTPAQD